jgi:acylphosphatase
MSTEGMGHVGRAYRVRGRVQGVGFRWWARGVAVELGLGGTVRNLPDGSVEVRATGAPAEMDRFEDLLRRGPVFARVDRLDAIEVEAIARPDEFKIDL